MLITLRDLRVKDLDLEMFLFCFVFCRQTLWSLWIRWFSNANTVLSMTSICWIHWCPG